MLEFEEAGKLCLCENQIAQCPHLSPSAPPEQTRARLQTVYELSVCLSQVQLQRPTWETKRQSGMQTERDRRVEKVVKTAGGETVCSFVCICECCVRPGSLMNMNLTEKRALVLHSLSSTKYSLGSSCAWTHTHFCCPRNAVVD